MTASMISTQSSNKTEKRSHRQSSETKSKNEPDYKEKCKTLKRKLRFLVHEQECFQEELRKAQRKLLKVSRDKNFLLDRLLQYEKVVFSGSDSEPTDSSDDEKDSKKPVQPIPPEKPKVKRKPKKKPAKKLQADPKLGPGKTVLPIQLQSPPSSLKQHMPQLVEMLNRAAATSVGPVSPDTFAGLPYSPAYAAVPQLPNPGSLAQIYDQLSPTASSSVLPSLLLNHPHYHRMNMMRNTPGLQETPQRKKVRKDSSKSASSQSNPPKTSKPEQPSHTSQPKEEPTQLNGGSKDTAPAK